jgi:hypothetical protein
MTTQAGVRAAMALLALSALAIGLPASFVPRSFYDSFPLGLSWVDKLPPYNAHLVTDTGGFYLAFGALFAWAAVRPSRELVVPLCCAWSLAALLHLRFHAVHLGALSTGNAIAQTVGLAAVLVLPLVVAVALRERAPA